MRSGPAISAALWRSEISSGGRNQYNANQLRTTRGAPATRPLDGGYRSRDHSNDVPAIITEEDEQSMNVSVNLPVTHKPISNYAFASHQPSIVARPNQLTASRNGAAPSHASSHLGKRNSLVSYNPSPAKRHQHRDSTLSVTQGPWKTNRAPQKITFGQSYKGLSVNDFKVGMVFKAAHYVEMMDKTVAPDHYSHVESRVGVCSAKSRHMILINKLGRNLLVLTVGSKGGRGLEGINDKYHEDYMVFQHPGGPKAPVQGPHNPIDVTEWGAYNLLTPTSMASLLEPYLVCSRQDVFIEGMISKDSYHLIVDLFTERMQFGFQRFPYGT